MASNSRLYAKLEQCKEARDFYQAHQICRTIYARTSTNDNNHRNVLDFLFESASYFLTHNQSNSGYDLCKCYIETLNRTIHNDLTETILKQICSLFQLLKSFHDERIEFACNVLRWSETVPSDRQQGDQLPVIQATSSLSSSLLSTLAEPSPSSSTPQRIVYHKHGHPRVHQAFARILWQQEGNYKESRFHYLHSHDGASFAAMLIEVHQKHGYPSEVDLFIAQTVLQYILLRNFQTAQLVFVTYVEQHPKIRQPPPGPFDRVYPMLNFIWFLLLCLKKTLVKIPANAASGEPTTRTGNPLSSETIRSFSALVDAYKPSLERDSTLSQYVDRIGVLFFGLKQKTTSTNPFENLMQSLTGVMQGHQHQQQASELDLDVD